MNKVSNTANNVLYFYGYGGYEAGSFTSSLLSTISLSDSMNRDRLEAVFPLEVKLMSIAMDERGGIEKIQALAAGDAEAIEKFEESYED